MIESSIDMRHQKQFTNDNPNKEVFPLDCVPDNRPNGSWTQGVKAWTKADGGSSDSVAGWFHPPRPRNKGHKKRHIKQISFQEEEEE